MKTKYRVRRVVSDPKIYAVERRRWYWPIWKYVRDPVTNNLFYRCYMEAIVAAAIHDGEK